ncbi:hypothetical protein SARGENTSHORTY9_96 [Mycobacterium phage SargentShorty9]|nr:hypothetical protein SARGENTSHORTY9_96 [Mycobacterium phage SargentShorty9]
MIHRDRGDPPTTEFTVPRKGRRTERSSEMNSTVKQAIALGREAGVQVQPWGGDEVRLNGGMIMSASDAIGWGIRRASAR